MVELDVLYNDFRGGTYFRTSDVAPYIDGAGRLVLQRGVGPSRSWGRWSVRSDVFALSSSVVMVTVTGWHKHTISPVGGVYYFVREGGLWVRRTKRYHAAVSALADVAPKK